MNICHIISSIDNYAGGPSKSVTESSGTLLRYGINSTLFTIKSENPYLFNNNSNNIILANRNSVRKELKETINLNNISLLHGHGIWEMPVHFMTKYARSKSIPYIISPHGMLDQWCLQKKKIKKLIALTLYQQNDLMKASCILASSESEARNINKLKYKVPIAVIPNGLNVFKFPNEYLGTRNDYKNMVYLSRIHPQKGLDLLIEALSSLSAYHSNWNLRIIGDGNKSYLDHINNLIREKHLEDKISIEAPVYSNDKYTILQNADLFVLPTFSESFGMAIAEALACGTPVLTTTGAPWEELNIKNAGWWIDLGIESLTKTLADIMTMPNSRLREMGNNGRKLIEEKYSLDIVVPQLIHLYNWILGIESKPSFIYD